MFSGAQEMVCRVGFYRVSSGRDMVVGVAYCHPHVIYV